MQDCARRGGSGDVPSATLAARLDCALEYLKKRPETRAIVTGGQAMAKNVTEASAMRAYLKRGESTQSESTRRINLPPHWKNLQNAQEILKEILSGRKRGSSSFQRLNHLYRAKLVAQKLG